MCLRYISTSSGPKIFSEDQVANMKVKARNIKRMHAVNKIERSGPNGTNLSLEKRPTTWTNSTCAAVSWMNNFAPVRSTENFAVGLGIIIPLNILDVEIIALFTSMLRHDFALQHFR
jgi:hypothetical protein